MTHICVKFLLGLLFDYFYFELQDITINSDSLLND